MQEPFNLPNELQDYPIALKYSHFNCSPGFKHLFIRPCQEERCVNTHSQSHRYVLKTSNRLTCCLQTRWNQSASSFD